MTPASRGETCVRSVSGGLWPEAPRRASDNAGHPTQIRLDLGANSIGLRKQQHPAQLSVGSHKVSYAKFVGMLPLQKKCKKGPPSVFAPFGICVSGIRPNCLNKFRRMRQSSRS